MFMSCLAMLRSRLYSLYASKSLCFCQHLPSSLIFLIITLLNHGGNDLLLSFGQNFGEIPQITEKVYHKKPNRLD